MTSGYGYVLLFEGIGTLIGAPVAGMLFIHEGKKTKSMHNEGIHILH